ncbi:MAG: endolytic transglycosylase MltG [Rikenellaceae bacterium]|nr:endolytic transglycosylase MltG [Rikenellaceae bacterium]
MIRKKLKILLSVFAVVLLLVAGTVAGIYFSVKSDAVSRSGALYLHTGSSYDELLDSLSTRVYNLKRFDRVARMLDADQTVRSGHYVIEKGTDYLQLARMFQRGWQSPVRVTFNNVRLVPQLAGKVAGQIEADSALLVSVWMNDTIPAYYGFKPEEFIGMFIPDTYEMYWTINPTAFLDRMKREYDHFWNPERELKQERLGLTRNEVITLASITYEETQKTDEMPRVAGVYINRLKIGMILQADPTLKFAVGDFTIRRVLDIHKAVDSPYNTYMYAGLPPGPICMPSIKAIDAVLDYEAHSYYYFCAREDFSGYHNFARTLPEHNRNAARYHAELNRRGIR